MPTSWQLDGLLDEPHQPPCEWTATDVASSTLTFRSKDDFICQFPKTKWKVLQIFLSSFYTLLEQPQFRRSILNADSFSIGLSDTDLCNCGVKETVSHFFICLLYQEEQKIMNDKLNNLLPHFKNSNANKNEIYLFGYNLNSEEFDCRNITINYAVQNYISATKRFQKCLYWNYLFRFCFVFDPSK